MPRKTANMNSDAVATREALTNAELLERHPLPDFDGKVVMPEDPGFNHSTYQYAKSSMPADMMMPLAIVYAASEEDVMKTVNYAHTADIAISVRSGGHHMLGASSCNGRNIQLDMSGYMYDPEAMGLPADTPYPFHFIRKEENMAGRVLVEVGPAVCLETLSKWLMDPETAGESVVLGDGEDKGLFVPFGECRSVHFGGHCQTGGVSPFISTIFGLLCDYVQSITLVMADGDPASGSGVARKRVIRRDTTDPYEADIFFSTIGGSPGNFGVVVSATIAPLRDTDYPESRALIAVNSYSKARWKSLLELWSKWCQNGGAPEGMSVVITMMGHSFVWSPSDIDKEMQDEVPDLFFGPTEGPCATYSQEQRDQMSAHWAHPLPMVMVTAFWCDRKNPTKKFEHSPVAQMFFQEAKDAIGYGAIPQLVASKAAKVLQDMDCFDPNKGHTPVSQFMRGCTLPLVREWLMPYHQRWFIADGDHSARSPTQFIADMTDRVEGVNLSSMMANFKAAQQFIPGGPGWTNKPDEKTSVSFRGADPATNKPFAAGFGAFTVFHNATEAGLTDSTQWVDEVYDSCFGEKGHVSKKDMRFIWAPHGSWNMDKYWHRYFDSRPKYERVLATKKKADPFDIFTPNAFCVGASSSAKLRRNVSESMADAWELGCESKRDRDADAQRSDAKEESLPRARGRRERPSPALA